MAAALLCIFLLPPSADKFVPWKWTLVAWPVPAKSFSGVFLRVLTQVRPTLCSFINRRESWSPVP